MNKLIFVLLVVFGLVACVGADEGEVSQKEDSAAKVSQELDPTILCQYNLIPNCGTYCCYDNTGSRSPYHVNIKALLTAASYSELDEYQHIYTVYLNPGPVMRIGDSCLIYNPYYPYTSIPHFGPEYYTGIVCK